MGQYRFAEANEVLISSFLNKKGSVSTRYPIRVKQTDMKKGTPLAHAHWWWPNSDHIYWCVLRKGQFSYYKTKDEREAIDVLRRSQILNYRVIPELIIFNLYTKDKTLSFGAESVELLERWTRALDEFLKFNDGMDFCNRKIEGNVVAPHKSIEFDRSSEDECEAAVFDTAFGLAVIDKDPSFQKAKIASFKDGYDNCNKDDTVESYESDTEFYKVYDPNNTERIVYSGELCVRVKTRINRTRWKKFKGILTNRTFRLCSIKTGRVKKEISLDTLIDCVEIEDSPLDTLFALVFADERLEFCSSDGNQVVDWIIAFKCGMLARRKLHSGIDANSK